VKASSDPPVLFIYYGEGVGRRSLARFLSRDAARRFAASIARLPGGTAKEKTQMTWRLGVRHIG